MEAGNRAEVSFTIGATEAMILWLTAIFLLILKMSGVGGPIPWAIVLSPLWIIPAACGAAFPFYWAYAKITPNSKLNNEDNDADAD